MNRNLLVAALMLPVSLTAFASDSNDNNNGPGRFSIGTRNTISLFTDDKAVGTGIGGQWRYRVLDRLNTEWFADYIPSQTSVTHREDYHIGWSLMYYYGHNIHFDHLLQPYVLAGHCFDYSVVSEKGNPSNSANRFTAATQAGLGTHLNFTKQFDCSLSVQYMLHYGKEINTVVNEGVVYIHRSDSVQPDGHLLFTVSFNYKVF